MNYLDGKPAMKGDTILFETPDGTVMSGNITQFFERQGQLMVGGYPLRVYASNALLGSECFAAVAGPIRKAEQEAKEAAIKQAAEEEAKVKAAQDVLEASRTAQSPPPVIQTPPAQQNAS